MWQKYPQVNKKEDFFLVAEDYDEYQKEKKHRKEKREKKKKDKTYRKDERWQ